MSSELDPRLAEKLFGLFLERSQEEQRLLFERLCRRYPDLSALLQPMYADWIRSRTRWEPANGREPTAHRPPSPGPSDVDGGAP